MTVRIINADVFEGLKQLPDESVDCVVTSPPYWGLRDYGAEGQIGMEPTLNEHLDVMVGLFNEVWRVLKADGTLWLNYGDCYATAPNGRSAADTKATGNDDRTFRDKPFSTVQGALKPKDLCMLPNRLAIALQEAGWWVRSEIIWAKPNPMPESVTDRPATSHEKVFLLSKSARYRYDADAARQNRTGDENSNGFRGGSYVAGNPGKRVSVGNYKIPTGWDTEPGAHGTIHREGRAQRQDYNNARRRGHARPHIGFNQRWDQMGRAEQQQNGRNLRNYEPAPMQVWEIATRPFKAAHFATFPPELVARCLTAAGVKPGDVVLDPFGGAGTTGLVAEHFGVDSVLIEISEDYVDIAAKRLRSELIRVEGAGQKDLHGPLFDFVGEGA